MALAAFGQCCNLACHTKVRPYNVYTHENVRMGAASIQSSLDVLTDEDKQLCWDKESFLDNIDKWGCVLGTGMSNTMFDRIKYSSIYCEMDCTTNIEGYDLFRTWMLEWTYIYVVYYITLQSSASTWMLKRGCYDKVYQLSGVLRQCLSKCVVGGRVMTASNKQYHVKRKVADVDACSLYPSAMYFMEDFLTILPEVLLNTRYFFLINNMVISL